MENQNRRHQYMLFLTAVLFASLAGGLNDSVFNNFLSDTFHLSANMRGFLELPRELPGFLVVLTSGLLASLAVTHVGVVAGLLFMLGLFGIALLGGSFWPMVLMMMLASTGMHLMMPVSSSIALSMGNESNRGRRMGQVGTLETSGAILGTGLIWLFLDRTSPQYRLVFIAAGFCGLITCLLYFRMHLPDLHQKRPGMVFRRKYFLYYGLELLFGARKQIFLTFGPWVLINVYHQPANSIAKLLMIAAFIGLFFKPFVGYLIDRFGERVVLIADGIVLILVCLGYGYALWLLEPKTAGILAGACFIGDNLLFALGAGRAIYVSRITDSKTELTSTLAMGVSINHVVSMTIPLVGGAIWTYIGFESVFLGAAFLALTISIVACFLPKKINLPA